MKRKEVKDLHSKTLEELKVLVGKASEELAKLKIDQKAGKLRNVHQLKQKSHDLARIKTVLKEMELHESIRR